MTYIVHHSQNSRAIRVLWLMEEMGLDYEVRFVPRESLKQPEYTKLNLLGVVPALEVDGQLLLESGAIIQFLVAKHSPTPLDVTKDEPGFAAFLQWLHFAEASFMNTFVNLARARNAKLPNADALQAKLQEQIAYIGVTLAAQPYIANVRFTAADIMLGYSLHLASKYNMLEGAPIIVQDYVARILERPAFGRALG